MARDITTDELIDLIKEKLAVSDKNIIIAIDGRCASGKTTLGKKLEKIFNANLFHADDFFLRKEQRTTERLNTPGGNFDKERFKEEVLDGIKTADKFYYSPFDCKTLSLKEKILVKQNRINIIEGSYCCHPDIIENYDVKIFVSTDANTQHDRILLRNKDMAELFFSRWIPFEEKYFTYFDIENKCDFIIRT